MSDVAIEAARIAKEAKEAEMNETARSIFDALEAEKRREEERCLELADRLNLQMRYDELKERYEAVLRALQDVETKGLTPKQCSDICWFYEERPANETRKKFSAELMKAIGESCLAAQQDRARIYSGAERSFYGLILAYGGELTMKLVTNAFGGPAKLSSVGAATRRV